MGSEETYEGKVGGRIKAVDDRARQKFKGRVRALGVVSPLSLNLLTKFAAIFVDSSEEVVEDFGVYGDDIPAIMEVYKLCFPNRSSHFILGEKDQVEMGTSVSKDFFSQDHHQAKGKYSSDRAIYYEDNFLTPKSETYHADIHSRSQDGYGDRQEYYRD